MIRIAVVDDHPHVAVALRALLKTPDIRLAAESRRGGDVAAIVGQRRNGGSSLSLIFSQ
jgi:DNA-binding NarL/FixJ family response regulator